MAILGCESFLRGGDVKSSKLSLADVVGSGDRRYRAPEVKALAFRTVSRALVNSFNDETLLTGQEAVQSSHRGTRQRIIRKAKDLDRWSFLCALGTGMRRRW